MNSQMIQFAKKLGVACAVTLALAPIAYAEEYTMVVPAHALQRGSAFVLETVIRNVQTGQRAVMSQECALRSGTVLVFDCIQINPDPVGRRVTVRNIGPT